jgi:hypothetical protein
MEKRERERELFSSDLLRSRNRRSKARGVVGRHFAALFPHKIRDHTLQPLDWCRVVVVVTGVVTVGDQILRAPLFSTFPMFVPSLSW